MWSKGLVEWLEDGVVHLSVVFSWQAAAAYQRAVWWRAQGYAVRAGGPGLALRGALLAEVAEVGGAVDDALVRHNPRATRASRGCPVGCSFCLVPRYEGGTFTLLPEFTPRPILCDNNLSALPVAYQEYIIDKYQRLGVPLDDANSGFEPQSFDGSTYERWRQILRGPWRFAYDTSSEENAVRAMAEVLAEVPAWDKRVYVLIGNEPQEVCVRRVHQVIEWGCEPFVQPLMALNALEKRPLVRFDWTARSLMNLARWANRWFWRRVSWSEYGTLAVLNPPKQRWVPEQLALE